jgi:hypothetical protein
MIGLLALAGVAAFTSACGDDGSKSLHTNEQLRGALLTVADVSFIPAEWEENMRDVVEAPKPPFEGTLDPYLCSEAGIPRMLTMPQAQLELTGGSAMEILLSSKDAPTLYNELDAAYKACGAGTSLEYKVLDGVPSIGDQSASYLSERGFVTIARFDTDLMVLKWLVGDFADQSIQYYPKMMTTAAKRVTDL